MKQIKEIMEMVININNKTKHTTFINFSGHIDEIDITIHIDGWKNKDKKFEEYNNYLNKITSKPKSYGSWLKENESIIKRFELQTDKLERKKKKEIIEYLSKLLKGDELK